jgi:hypothetical protein
VFLGAAALCVLQCAALLLTVRSGGPDALQGAALLASVLGAVWALHQALSTPVPFTVRVAPGGDIELRTGAGVLAAHPAHAGSRLIVLRTVQPRPRAWLIWGDSLPRAEFRRLVTAARWSRPGAAADIGDPA